MNTPRTAPPDTTPYEALGGAPAVRRQVERLRRASGFIGDMLVYLGAAPTLIALTIPQLDAVKLMARLF